MMGGVLVRLPWQLEARILNSAGSFKKIVFIALRKDEISHRPFGISFQSFAWLEIKGVICKKLADWFAGSQVDVDLTHNVELGADVISMIVDGRVVGRYPISAWYRIGL